MKLSKLLKVVLATTLTLSASTASAAFVYSYTGNGFDFLGTYDGSASNDFRTCSTSFQKQGQESEVNELQAGVERAFAVFP